MAGILAYGAYVPRGRLDRAAVAATLGVPAPKGSRAVASFDEDTTSMAVEAARAALRHAATRGHAGTDVSPATVLFATAAPAYLDRTNATVVHAALGLDPATAAYDAVGSVRSAVGALRLAAGATEPTLVIGSDLRVGLPGGADELGGGDAAAAFLFGDGPALAEIVAHASATREFLDRWRVPGEPTSRTWEERFAESAYLPLGEAAVTDVLKRSGLTLDDMGHVVVAGLHDRSRDRLAKSLGTSTRDDISAVVGNAGAALPGLLLADALDRAAPGDHILLVSLADGADAIVLRVTDAIAERPAPLRDSLAAEAVQVGYPTYLTWRGLLQREPPRRPDPEPPSPPVSNRHEEWKFAFSAGRCERCGTRHLPPVRVCMTCGAVDEMRSERLADVPGTVVTYTVDRLTYSLSPPVVAVVIDFDGGGRFQCELADGDPSSVAIGDRVEMTFRRMHTARGGVHNYFWKARPVRGAGG